MAARALPNLGLKAFYDLGENGWGDDMSLNLLKLSVLVQGGAAGVLAALPGAPADGDVVILDDAHPTHANAVAVYDAAAWVYISPMEGWLLYDRLANAYVMFNGAAWVTLDIGGGGGGDPLTENIIIAAGDELSALTVGVAKITFRMPYAFLLSDVRASLTASSSSGTPTVDINENGASILSTKLTIDATEKTSTTAAVPAVISDATLANDSEITIDIDVAGTAATGLKVYLIGVRVV